MPYVWFNPYQWSYNRYWASIDLDLLETPKKIRIFPAGSANGRLEVKNNSGAIQMDEISWQCPGLNCAHTWVEKNKRRAESMYRDPTNNPNTNLGGEAGNCTGHSSLDCTALNETSKAGKVGFGSGRQTTSTPLLIGCLLYFPILNLGAVPGWIPKNIRNGGSANRLDPFRSIMLNIYDSC